MGGACDQNRGFVPHRKISLGKYSIDPQLIYLLLKSILCCIGLLNYVYKKNCSFQIPDLKTSAYNCLTELSTYQCIMKKVNAI